MDDLLLHVFNARPDAYAPVTHSPQAYTQNGDDGRPLPFIFPLHAPASNDPDDIARHQALLAQHTYDQQVNAFITSYNTRVDSYQERERLDYQTYHSTRALPAELDTNIYTAGRTGAIKHQRHISMTHVDRRCYQPMIYISSNASFIRWVYAANVARNMIQYITCYENMTYTSDMGDRVKGIRIREIFACVWAIKSVSRTSTITSTTTTTAIVDPLLATWDWKSRPQTHIHSTRSSTLYIYTHDTQHPFIEHQPIPITPHHHQRHVSMWTRSVLISPEQAVIEAEPERVPGTSFGGTLDRYRYRALIHINDMDWPHMQRLYERAEQQGLSVKQVLEMEMEMEEEEKKEETERVITRPTTASVTSMKKISSTTGPTRRVMFEDEQKSKSNPSSRPTSAPIQHIHYVDDDGNDDSSDNDEVVAEKHRIEMEQESDAEDAKILHDAQVKQGVDVKDDDAATATQVTGEGEMLGVWDDQKGEKRLSAADAVKLLDSTSSNHNHLLSVPTSHAPSVTSSPSPRGRRLTRTPQQKQRHAIRRGMHFRDLTCPRLKITRLEDGTLLYSEGSHISTDPPMSYIATLASDHPIRVAYELKMKKQHRRNSIVPVLGDSQQQKKHDTAMVNMGLASILMPHTKHGQATPTRANSVFNLNVMPTSSATNSTTQNGKTHGTYPGDAAEYHEHPLRHFTIDQFKHYGLGIALYFRFLRSLAWMFLVLALIATPQLFLSIAANVYIANTWNGLEKTTIGNFGYHHNSTGISDTHVDILGTVYLKSDITAVCSALDALGTIVFIAALWKITKKQDAEIQEYDTHEITITNYTVQVTGLPSFFDDRLRLAEFMERRFGPVVDIALTYNDHCITQLYAKRGGLCRELLTAKAQEGDDWERDLQHKLKEIDHAITKAQAELGDRQTVAAYITFEHQSSRKRCEQAFQNGWLPYLWATATRNPASYLMFDDYVLSVRQAPEPSNILFPNLQYSRLNKLLRRIGTAMLTVVLLCMSVVAVYFAQNYQTQGQQTSCPSSISLSSLSSPTNTTSYDQLEYCYCLSLGVRLLQDSTHCSRWISEYLVQRTLLILSVFTIVIVNNMLKFLVSRVVRWEAHSSLTSMQTSITKKLFVGLFLNTAVVLLLVNARLNRISSQTGTSLLFSGRFDDFTSSWFESVGTSILITMMLGILNPHVIPLLCVPIHRCRRTKCISPNASQWKINKKFAGYQFLLADRYAVCLNVVFVTLTYSGGMPLLLWSAFLTMVCMYWFDKISFLRLYRTPARFDHTLARLALRMLQYGAVLHLAFSCWFYSSPPMTGKDTSSSQTLADTLQGTVERLTQWPIATSTLLLMILLLLLIARGVYVILDRIWPRDGIDEQDGIDLLAMPHSVATQHVQLESYHTHQHQLYRDAYQQPQAASKKKETNELQIITQPAEHEMSASEQQHHKSDQLIAAQLEKPISLHKLRGARWHPRLRTPHTELMRTTKSEAAEFITAYEKTLGHAIDDKGASTDELLRAHTRQASEFIQQTHHRATHHPLTRSASISRTGTDSISRSGTSSLPISRPSCPNCRRFLPASHHPSINVNNGTSSIISVPTTCPYCQKMFMRKGNVDHDAHMDAVTMMEM